MEKIVNKIENYKNIFTVANTIKNQNKESIKESFMIAKMKMEQNEESNRHQFFYRNCKITIRKGNLIDEYV